MQHLTFSLCQITERPEYQHPPTANTSTKTECRAYQERRTSLMRKESKPVCTHHFVRGSDDSVDQDSSYPTPLREPQTPTPIDSPSQDNSNPFNKATLSVTKLELDSPFQDLIKKGFKQDQLREILKKDTARSVNKLAK
ncbi:MAG: hypothetical protein Q9180_008028, partial [Flavoplaca navasiana]